MAKTVNIAFKDAQRIFDLAVSADQACSGFRESDDVAAMRRLALSIGVDPSVCTGEEFLTQFPHQFVPGVPDLGRHRRRVTTWVSQVGDAMNVSTSRPETDGEVLARLGRELQEVCVAGRWAGRCGKTADDPIHTAEETR